MRAAAIRAGGVDWAEHWRHLVAERTSAGGRGATNAAAWDERAARFARMAADLDPAADPLVTTLGPALRASDALLDVGAGAGRYTLPLAPLVERVTAVEPSAGMRAALGQAVDARGLKNVSVVPATWEDARVDDHDVALVSNVLQMVEDIVPFIEKLDAVASRACYVFIRVESRESLFSDVWRQVWGRDPFPEPNLLDLYNLLFSLGIRAHVRLGTRRRGETFANMDEAVRFTRTTLQLPEDDATRDGLIRSFLEDRVVREPDGRLAIALAPQSAVVWWEK